MVTDVCAQSRLNYDWLHIVKSLGNFRKSYHNNKKKNNVRSAWGPFSGSEWSVFDGVMTKLDD